jgi:MFS family permease
MAVGMFLFFVNFDSFQVLLLARIIQGVSGSLTQLAANVLLYDLYFQRQKILGRMQSLLRFSGPLAYVAGPLLSAALYEQHKMVLLGSLSAVIALDLGARAVLIDDGYVETVRTGHRRHGTDDPMIEATRRTDPPMATSTSDSVSSDSRDSGGMEAGLNQSPGTPLIPAAVQPQQASNASLKDDKLAEFAALSLESDSAFHAFVREWREWLWLQYGAMPLMLRDARFILMLLSAWISPAHNALAATVLVVHLKQHFAFSATDSSLFQLSLSLPFLLLCYPAGYAVDRTKGKLLWIIGPLAVMCVATLLLALPLFHENLTLLIVAGAVLSAASIPLFPASASIMLYTLRELRLSDCIGQAAAASQAMYFLMSFLAPIAFAHVYHLRLQFADCLLLLFAFFAILLAVFVGGALKYGVIRVPDEPDEESGGASGAFLAAAH